jgi:D-methionine transport system permease protein
VNGLLDDLLSNPAITTPLWPALVETLQMVGIAGIATVLIGLPLGVVLFARVHVHRKPVRGDRAAAR